MGEPAYHAAAGVSGKGEVMDTPTLSEMIDQRVGETELSDIAIGSIRRMESAHRDGRITLDNYINGAVCVAIMKAVGSSSWHVPFLDDGEIDGFFLPSDDGDGYGFVKDEDVPDYANDIAAAWQVALKVASLPGYSVTIHVGDEVWIEKAVETDSGNTHLITWRDVARVGTAEGDARAICLAALDAVGVRVAVRPGVSMTWDISEKDHDELRSMLGVEVE